MKASTKKTLILIIAGICLIIFAYLIRKAIAAILPLFLCSGILAYFFVPLVRALEKRTYRSLAIVISFGMAFSALFAFFRIVIPILFAQAMDIITLLPSYLEKAFFYLDKVKEQLKTLPLPADLDGVILSYSNKLAQTVDGYLSGFAEGLTGIFSFISFAFFVPVLTFYILRDRNELAEKSLFLIPEKWRGDVQKVMHNMNREMRRFVVGQLTVALIHTVMSSAGSAIIGLKNALLLGAIMGFSNMIPYIGPLLGSIPILIAGLSMGPEKFLLALIMVLVVEQIDNMFISPNIIGNNIKTHPVIVMICILGGSALFGLVGMLLAVPAFIMLRIAFRSVYSAIIDAKTKNQTNYTKY